jgi:hypothetical protein
MGAIIAWRNLAELWASSIRTDNESATLGVRSLLTPQIQDIWRSGAWAPGAALHLWIDLGSVSDLRLFAVAAPRDGVLPGAGAQWRITASQLGEDGTEILDTGLMSLAMAPNGLAVHLAGAVLAARFVRLRFIAGPEDRYFQLGRLWLGPALVTASASSYGQARGSMDSGSNERAALSGVRYGTPGMVRRTASWSVNNMGRADADGLEAAALQAGTTRQIFAAPLQASPAREGMFGTFTRVPEPRMGSHLRWSADISTEEDL